MKMTAAPCIIAVPSMLIVAPRGIVNEATFGSTPIFFSRVSIFSGMVAFEELVENANSITGSIFRKNCSGFSRVNRKRSSM